MEQVSAELLSTVRKVIAVHLAYKSRAEQRGRIPSHPSYFLKAPSSLSLSGSVVERPVGCELLAYEGEIALVIAKAARRVSPAEAWSHIGHVTAANDLGVYDLKYADKGSNVRSKSGDGFTPLGPGLIPAAGLDPHALRLRTWLNGELVQDDTTAGLLFSFSQIVADLSQLMTLEPGDVILTGTPAGSSVAVPGDVLEVQLDSPGTGPSTGLSTGRLRTSVVQGSGEWTGYDAVPRISDADRVDAWGSAEAAGLASTSPSTALSAELQQKLISVGTATLSSQLRKRGFNNIHIEGLSCTKAGLRIAGTARTLRFVPFREDLFAAHGGGFNAQKRAIDSLNDGEILVMEARGDPTAGTLGDLLALRAQVRGAAAIVTDGGVRDLTEIAALDIPVFHHGTHPAVLGRRHVPWDTDLTISCGGATVQPGDIIVGDDTGVLVIPASLAQEVADAAIAQEHEEKFIAEMVAQGHGIQGLFPMNATWRATFTEWESSHSEQKGGLG
ncbi:fumarylacetoacetate hydrolase family protein [Arthrobacter psychrochitiniphilus]|uniref:Fumarylacetoacetate hydrolase family protein n=1 Tax=Arthrobacter psychrochitiniphilus TaxID=291045 RepID=A0A2V3DUI6_9MICC|nr:fumarylacetoacetate hydrolase family protein [Arthrobacter psychrochitiniphilus]NYG15781.1 2-keto-4-pentenoate hydratase/2-oxohepta-3-ene-1,7-dioic acid hydratase in catechol pathway/regulator of RNase E activity RraA [Arthrobacter psychrochitiniphilus]PXA66766.1 fumarylacetoacetate hydrolase family protein [Arthrobacter psychrochitiniphilus]